MPEGPPGFLPAGGNYHDLLSYKKSEVIYDFTFRFCEKFLNRGDRTIDQMVQAARSGKQNIAEGSKASTTSTEMELKLTNVARASLEELLLNIRTISKSAITRCGRRTLKKRSTSANSANPLMSPMKPIGHIPIPAHPRSWQTSPSA